ncbi:MAG: KilA-N domain-containing protein [Bacteroidota bacterium]
MSNQKIIVDGQEITIKQVDDHDYISITDMAKRRNPDNTIVIIRAWLKRNATLRFIELFEQMTNPNFNPFQMEQIRNEMAEDANYISAKQLINRTNAIGIQSRAGRYGGTYAHRDIAFEFATWLSPEFKFYLIKEFQRLKQEEQAKLDKEWDYTRFLSKINYGLQTKAIEENILPRLEKKDQSFVYATEADLINLAVFGLTAKQWRERYPEQAKKGNIRDFASIQHLTVLSNLQSLNSELIRRGAEKEARFYYLCEAAQFQLRTLTHDNRLQKPGDSLSLND